MNLEANKEALLEAIKQERAYQDANWGPLSEQKPKSLAGWLTIIEAELDESRQGWVKSAGNNAALEELLQVAATWVACISQSRTGPIEEWLPSFLDSSIKIAEADISGEYDEASLEQLLGELKHRHLSLVWKRTRASESEQMYTFIKLGRHIMLTLLRHGIVTRFGQGIRWEQEAPVDDDEQVSVMSTCSRCGEEVPDYLCAYNDGKRICDICCIRGKGVKS